MKARYFLKRAKPFVLIFLISSFTSIMAMNSDFKSRVHQGEKATVQDPLKVKIHRLSNGLTLYMSINPAEPRISTNIAVRAGSKHDPAHCTGLAHYLEHMMFKGTSSLGALDWKKEQILLDSIADLYELHRQTKDSKKRKDIYDKIDRISNQASKHVAANEYDKLISSLGAKGTNAYTWVEQTVYVNDIPSNELEKWFKLESERFSELVLRLFHTELEAVYEEYNISQDRDFRKTMKAVMGSLFPSHPYGTQTTIGEGEHLKNPSHYEIHKFFKKYYVPNNMAIVLSGDFDPDNVIALAEKYFGQYKAQSIEPWMYEPQKDLDEKVVHEVYGQESPYLDMAWKFDGANTEDALKVQLLKGILFNKQAGILDLNLNKQQKLIDGEAWNWIYEDYSVLGLSAKPREGQTLEEIEQLLFGAVEDLQKGNFEEWLIEAVIKDFRLSELKSEKSNNARVYKMTNSFILGLDWEDFVLRHEKMEQFSKKELADFAKEHMRMDNCVVVRKLQGEDSKVEKVDKPKITPIDLVKDEKSDFAREWLSDESPELDPVFLDFEKDLKHSTSYRNGVNIHSVKNSNGYFNLLYVYEMGKNADKKMDLAIQYLPFLGTDELSSEEFQKEMFKLGLEFNSFHQNERIYLSLSGLEESIKDGIALIDQLLENVTLNELALGNLIEDIQTQRQNDKSDKRKILRNALYSYVKYGEESPFTNILSNQELEDIKGSDLIQKIKQLNKFKHNIFFYGDMGMDELISVMEEFRSVPDQLISTPENKVFSERPTVANNIYVVDFPIVQAEVMFLSKGNSTFDLEEYMASELYNSYFGFGLSSIVFQEIRESRALAYSAYAYNAKPQYKDRAHYLSAYVGTQADKMADAIVAMREILDDMPVVSEQIENARQSIKKKIESDRITEANIYWTYQTNERLGHPYDLRKAIYRYVELAGEQELKEFHKAIIKDRDYELLILADKSKIDMEFLRSYGNVIELSLEDIFAY